MADIMGKAIVLFVWLLILAITLGYSLLYLPALYTHHVLDN